MNSINDGSPENQNFYNISITWMIQYFPYPFFNLRIWWWYRMDIISTIIYFFYDFISYYRSNAIISKEMLLQQYVQGFQVPGL